MKILDYIIIAAILGCLAVAYSGFRIEAALMSLVLITVASWRFWDRSREKHMIRSGASGQECADHSESGDNSGSEAEGDD